MAQTLLNKWIVTAKKESVPSVAPTYPVHVLLSEAADVARFFDKYWASERGPAGKATRPGLELVADHAQLHAGLGGEIVELCEAVHVAQMHYRLSRGSRPKAPLGRARFVLRELGSTLSFLLDQGSDAEREQAKRVRASKKRANSHDGLAAALEEHAAFAEAHRQRIDGLGGFDPALIEEAKSLSKQLYEHPRPGASDERRAARQVRNQLCAMLYSRMQRVRAAARFVYRNHPEIVKQVTSAYQRQRTARYREQRAVKAEA